MLSALREVFMYCQKFFWSGLQHPPCSCSWELHLAASGWVHKMHSTWASVKSFVGSGSCKNSPIAAEEEFSWPELHNKFILLMVFNLVAGMVETFDNIFLAEKFKSLAVPSVCGNDSFWNSNRADLWELLVSCWPSLACQWHTLLCSQPGALAGGVTTGLPTGPPQASCASTLPFLILLKNQQCPEATDDS